MEFKQITNQVPEYWEGNKNILVRGWTYIKVGLNLVNDYKYVGMAILGIYVALMLNNWIWLVVMTLIALPSLLFLGRWWLYKGAKTSEFVITTKGTVLGYDLYNIQAEQKRILEEILIILKDEHSGTTPRNVRQ